MTDLEPVHTKDICMMCYWGRVNDDMFETSTRSFRRINKTALLKVYTDDIPTLEDDYDLAPLEWNVVPREQVKGRRALCKIELLQELISTVPDGSRILVSDVDVYFLDDPFRTEWDFDLGLTTRHYDYGWPINAGVFFIKVGPQIKKFMEFRLSNLDSASWDKYHTFEQMHRYHPDMPKLHPDWYVDQDFLCTVWLNREEIEGPFGIKITDCGPYWNYCPDSCSLGYDEAHKQLREAYFSKKAGILHLKSKLKMAIYEGWLPEVITKRKCTVWNWYKDG